MLCPVLFDSKVDICYKWRQHVFICTKLDILIKTSDIIVQGGSNMTGTDLYVNKPHCAAAVRP